MISNCVINLTTNKVDTFKEGNRIINQGQGKMIISDLVTDKEVQENSPNQSVSRTINPSLLSSEMLRL